MAARQTCFYKFPMHPADIFQRTPSTVEPSSRGLRVQMMEMLATASTSFSQEQLDTRVLVDIEKDGEIIGIDMSGLVFKELPPGSMCGGGGTPVPLGRLTAGSWIHMNPNAA